MRILYKYHTALIFTVLLTVLAIFSLLLVKDNMSMERLKFGIERNVLVLFKHNFLICLTIILGGLTLSFISIAYLSISLFATFSGFFDRWFQVGFIPSLAILPHGIFEIFALYLAFKLALMISRWLFAYLFLEKRQFDKKYFIKLFSVMLVSLILAAAIEVYVRI